MLDFDYYFYTSCVVALSHTFYFLFGAVQLPQDQLSNKLTLFCRKVPIVVSPGTHLCVWLGVWLYLAHAVIPHPLGTDMTRYGLHFITLPALYLPQDGCLHFSIMHIACVSFFLNYESMFLAYCLFKMEYVLPYCIKIILQ